MFAVVSADTVYKIVVKCIPIHLGFESCVVYNTVSILAMSDVGDIHCVARKKRMFSHVHSVFESYVIYRCERSQLLPQTVALSLLDTSPGKTGLFLSNQKSARFR